MPVSSTTPAPGRATAPIAGRPVDGEGDVDGPVVAALPVLAGAVERVDDPARGSTPGGPRSSLPSSESTASSGRRRRSASIEEEVGLAVAGVLDLPFRGSLPGHGVTEVEQEGAGVLGQGAGDLVVGAAGGDSRTGGIVGRWCEELPVVRSSLGHRRSISGRGRRGGYSSRPRLVRRNSASVLTWGNGSSGSGRSRAAHSGPQSSPVVHSIRRPAGTADRTSARWRS